MEKVFDNKIAIVTGGSCGIGKATAKAVALENAKQGIRVNAICPGVIQTLMIDRLVSEHPEMKPKLDNGEPIGRIGRPEEIAEPGIWLCSEGASFLIGQAIAVDGGWVAQ